VTVRTRIFSTICVVAALAILSSPALAQKSNSVIDVQVKGNKQLSRDDILADVKTRAGQPYDETIAKADQRRLLLTGRFDSVVVTKTQADKGVIVTFVVSERSLVVEISFRNNKEFDRKDLLEELPFGVGDPLNRFMVESGRQAILAKYRSDGYFFVEVTWDNAAMVTQQQVIYTIVEGPDVAIRKIRFQGNDFFSTFRLRQTVNSSSGFWPFLPGTLDMEQVERDVQGIANRYVSEGFLDAEVGRDLEFSQDKRKVVLTFVIREGPRYRVNRAIFKGNTIFSGEELARRLSLQQGGFFTALKLLRDIRKLENTYGELGYIEARAVSAKQFLDPKAPLPDWAAALDQPPALLNVVFTIVERDQFSIGQITIRGNTVTHDHVIRRQLLFFPEQLFNTVAVNKSQRRLRESRLFDDATITPTGKAPKVRNVLVTVKEGRTAEFLIGLGVSSNSGLLGNIALTQRNFDLLGWPGSWEDVKKGRAWKGGGQTLRIVAEPGTELYRFYIDLFEPYVLDQPYSLGAKVFVFNRGREDYDELRYGGVFSFGHRFKNRWYGELAARLEGVDVQSVKSTAPPEVTAVAGSNVLLGLKGTLIRDRTDSRWAPSQGDRISFSYEQVGGDFTFGTTFAEYKIYRTVYVDAVDRKHIISGRGSVGKICGDAPVFERFYGGGIGSVRGFAYRGISPRSAGTTKQIGGDFILLLGMEDGVTTYRSAFGFGLRWIIPFFGPVPLSLSFGFPLSQDTKDDTQLVSFSLGVTF